MANASTVLDSQAPGSECRVDLRSSRRNRQAIPTPTPTPWQALAVGGAMGKSAELWAAAAQAGDGEAQFALALRHLLGRGVTKNSAEAFRLFGLALDSGDERAATFRDLAAQQMALEQISERQMAEPVRHAA